MVRPCCSCDRWSGGPASATSTKSACFPFSVWNLRPKLRFSTRIEPIMLRVDHVCKTFAAERGRGDFEVLRDIRFEVTSGEFVSIIGPSGCGKTTLLRILHGLEPATSGTVFMFGARIQHPSPRSAMVFQQFNLFPWLTVTQNVAFGL